MARRPSSECPEIDAGHPAADAGKEIASMSVSELPVDMEFLFFERTDCDLPYYREAPDGFNLTGWLMVMCSVAAAFVVLTSTQLLFHSGFAGFIPPLLFILIPLVAVAAVAGPRAPLALFRPLALRDIGIIILFFVLNAIMTVAVGLLITGLFHTAVNPAGDMVASASASDKILFFGWTGVQLLGEEIFTILIFLGALTLLNRVMSRKVALCLAALIAAIIFALVHLPTYQWNMAQALVGLIPVRLVLLLPYIITRNIWVSTGVHVLNDWTIFGMSAIAGMDAG
jgi:hypothetical protein